MKLDRNTKLQIAKRARTLVRKRWTQGAWKESRGTDKNGNQKFAYCLEGACNQAAIDVLGLEGARQVGAAKVNSFTGKVDVASDGLFTRKLSVYTASRLFMAQKLGLKRGYGGSGFNDRADTKKADIIAVFDNYIKELDS